MDDLGFSLLPLGVNRIWPAYVNLLEDELLSSWLVRIAHSHCMALNTFTGLHFPGMRFWNRSVDISLPDYVLQSIAENTHSSLDIVKGAMLSSYEGSIFVGHRQAVDCKWIKPLSRHHRIIEKSSIAFCPSCLSKDGDSPYYRKRWRLSLSVCCTDCGTMLRERCPKCLAAVSFFGNEAHRDDSLDFLPISFCNRCHFDLSMADAEGVSQLLLETQKGIYQMLDNGVRDNPVPAHLYFDAFRKIATTLMAGKGEVAQKLQQHVSKELKLPYMTSCEKPKRFDAMEINERSLVLQMAYWSLQEWPFRFIDVMKRLEVW